jgi:hypothetical protein
MAAAVINLVCNGGSTMEKNLTQKCNNHLAK